MDKATEEAAVVTEEKAEVVESLSPVETQALDQGWMPLEKWVEAGNNEKDHRSAKEFVERGALYSSLSQTKGELKKTQAALTALQRHHQYVFEKAHQKALEDLKLQRRHALREDDADAVEQIENAIEQTKEEHEKAKTALIAEQQATTVQLPPEWDNWKSRNVWYDTEQDMKDEADSVGIVYLNRYPGSPPMKVLEHVEREMKKRYPQKFGVKRAAPSAVTSVDRTSRSSPKTVEIELDDLEREIMRQLVSSGEMTEQEYKAELKKAKGIK